MSDDSAMYNRAEHMFIGHESVNHSAGEYVRGVAHVNTAEERSRSLKAWRYGGVSSLEQKAPASLSRGI